MDQLLLGVLALQLRIAQISLEQMQPAPVEAAVMTHDDYVRYAFMSAQQYDIDAEKFTEVLKCESQYKPDAVGDHGTSFGCAQIHLPAHPEVTREQALDCAWSINWSAIQFARGDAKWWTCYHLLGFDST